MNQFNVKFNNFWYRNKENYGFIFAHVYYNIGFNIAHVCTVQN